MYSDHEGNCTRKISPSWMFWRRSQDYIFARKMSRFLELFFGILSSWIFFKHVKVNSVLSWNGHSFNSFQRIFPRSCSPKCLVVPFGTSGMVQVDRPLVLVPLVPRRSEYPLLLVPLVPLRSEDPLLLVTLVPRTSTCPNLSHLVVPLVLSQLSFLRFFFGFFITFPYFEKHLWMNFSKSTYRPSIKCTRLLFIVIKAIIIKFSS